MSIPSKHKHEPDPILAFLKGLNADPKQTVYIGTLFMTRRVLEEQESLSSLHHEGAHSSEDFKQVDFILRNLKVILKFFKSLNKKLTRVNTRVSSINLMF